MTEAALACFPCFDVMQFEFDFLRLNLPMWIGCSPPRLEQSKTKEVAGGVLRVLCWRLFLTFHFYFGKIDGREMELFSSMLKPAVSHTLYIYIIILYYICI